MKRFSKRGERREGSLREWREEEPKRPEGTARLDADRLSGAFPAKQTRKPSTRAVAPSAPPFHWLSHLLYAPLLPPCTSRFLLHRLDKMAQSSRAGIEALLASVRPAFPSCRFLILLYYTLALVIVQPFLTLPRRLTAPGRHYQIATNRSTGAASP